MGRREDETGQASTIVQAGPASGGDPSEQTVPAGDSSPGLSDLAPGATVGRYCLVERLGAGAMGVVWSAQDPQLDRRVAIKVVHPSLARSPDASGRLLREARAMAKLSHRAVVTVHDAGDVDGRLFLAMELVQGTTLGQMLRSRTDASRADWRKWLAMMLDAGRGLAAAHGAGVLHRDFKPDNILVETSGRVCVADFGLATLGEDVRGTSVRASTNRMLELTTTGALLGTPVYMSPQQLRGEPIDARADQFNFCVATWEALYTTRPFAVPQQGLDALVALEEEIVAGRLVAPPAETLVPDAIRDVLARGLAAQPDARWLDMTSLLAALERASELHGRRTATSPVAVSARRPRTLPIAAAIGALALIAGITIVVRRSDGPPPSTPPPSVPQIRRLFDVSLRTAIAMSPDGKRVALGSDRIEVRELGGPMVWSTPVPTHDDVVHLELRGDEVWFSLRLTRSIHRWRYTTTDPIDVVASYGEGRWHGDTLYGRIIAKASPERAVTVNSNGREVRRWPVRMTTDLVVPSPRGDQLAYLESDRFSGRIVIQDLARNRTFESAPLESPTALAWQDDHTLLYATSKADEPRLQRVRIEADGLGQPHEIYRAASGWFAELAVHGNQVMFTEMSPASRARLVERSGQMMVRDLDVARITVALGWPRRANDQADDQDADQPGELLTWSRSNRRVEKHALGGAHVATSIELPREPMNATLAGDVVIAAMRGSRGRELIAHSLATGKLLWRHAAGETLAVRCAGDQAPPCFALRSIAGRERILGIDAATGITDDRVVFEGNFEDIAVNAAGDRLLVPLTPEVHEIDTAGRVLARHPTPLTTIRAIAFDPAGGLLVGGTLRRNAFQVGRVHDGAFTVLAQAENDLLSLVRPSSDGARVTILSRVYTPVLWNLVLPP